MGTARIAVFLATTVAIVAAASSPSIAAPKAPHDGARRPVPVANQHLTHSTLKGSPKASRRGDLSTEEQFAAAAQRISDLFPDAYTTATWADPRDGHNMPSITVTEASSELRSIITSLPFDVDLITGANANAIQLERLSATVVSGVVQETGGTAPVVSTIDPDSLGVSVSFGGTIESVTAAVDEDGVVAGAAGKIGLNVLPVPVTVSPDSNVKASTEVTVKGGYSLTTSVGGSYACTSGFGASRNGTRGLITADHCPNTLYYEGVAGTISFVTGSAAHTEVDGDRWYYDVQFHRAQSGHTASATFRVQTGLTKSVTSVSAPVQGQSVCHFGMASAEKCDVVYSTGNCIYFPDAGKQYCGLASTRTNVSAGGDSGGPWFSGTVAKGTHTGVATIDSVRRSVFTSIGMVNAAVTATILHT